MIGLLPIIIEVTFAVLSFVAGATKGISIHHLDQIYKLTRDFNGRFGWTVLSGLVDGVFGQIMLYVSLMVIRKHHLHLEVGASVVQHLSWRYLITYLVVNLLQSFLVMGMMLVGLLMSVVGVVIVPKYMIVGIVIVIIGVLLGIFGPLYISIGWSQVPYLIKEAVDADDNQKLLKVLGDSWRLMRGFKFDLFVMYLSMFWWYLAVIFTLGIGWIFLKPYFYLALAGFHENIRRFDLQRRETGIK
jgi:uncharacterized membrane protein